LLKAYCENPRDRPNLYPPYKDGPHLDPPAHSSGSSAELHEQISVLLVDFDVTSAPHQGLVWQHAALVQLGLPPKGGGEGLLPWQQPMSRPSYKGVRRSEQSGVLQYPPDEVEKLAYGLLKRLQCEALGKQAQCIRALHARCMHAQNGHAQLARHAMEKPVCCLVVP
jgi:hypothetical protein